MPGRRRGVAGARPDGGEDHPAQPARPPQAFGADHRARADHGHVDVVVRVVEGQLRRRSRRQSNDVGTGPAQFFGNLTQGLTECVVITDDNASMHAPPKSPHRTGAAPRRERRYRATVMTSSVAEPSVTTPQ